MPLNKNKKNIVFYQEGLKPWTIFFWQRKPRKMPLNGLAPVQVSTRVGRKERVRKMVLGKQ